MLEENEIINIYDR